MNPADVDARLRPFADPARAAQEQRYLKSDLVHLGVTVPQCRVVAKALHTEARFERALIDALWDTGVYEHRRVAAEWTRLARKSLTRADLPWLQAQIRRAKTWALVDVLAPEVVGPILARDPGDEMDAWAVDPDFWVRRAALIHDLLRLRTGGGDWAGFCRRADPMLEEKEFFIRKAIGWVLRSVADKDPARVAAWVRPRVDRMSGLTLREATRKMPEALRVSLER